MLAVVPAHAAFSNWYVLLNDLLFVNFDWGLVNLLPVYPLDGGHAARAV
jgi:Zn-dependent protease